MQTDSAVCEELWANYIGYVSTVQSIEGVRFHYIVFCSRSTLYDTQI